jgi:hypothetical protein
MSEQLKGAVIIIGSLFWDKEPIRKYWRDHFLILNERKSVSLPIRYGRKSSTRGNTFTMVFSSECITAEKIGKGLLIPLRTEYSVSRHCEELIRAERNNLQKPKQYNYSFFALGLLINPKSNKRELLELSRRWINNFDDFKNDQYKVEPEVPIISNEGFLNIDWSEEFDGNDFLICTVMKSELKSYPKPIEIAERMIEANYYEYFCKNRNRGILTFQDEEIDANLP